MNYTVQAVIKDNPINSSFQFDVLMQMDGRLANPQTYKNDKSWNNFGYITFLQLQPNANSAAVATKINGLIDRNRTKSNDKVSLTPLSKMYFEDDLQSSDMPHGNQKTSYIFSLLGLLLLITACINYVNLTTAKASLRAKEVSVRKIVGGGRSSLFMQFMMESLVVSLLALIVTVIIIQICLPAFNAVTEKHFELPITSVVMWQILTGTLLFATILNGIYPAVLLSSFKPINVFRGRSISVKDASVRKGLVVFQFALSMLLIVGATVIYKQLQYVQTANPGYDVAQVMSLQIPYDAYDALDEQAKASFFENFKHDLQSQSSIGFVCRGSSEIVNVEGMSSGNADWDGRDTTYNPKASQGLQWMMAFKRCSRLRWLPAVGSRGGKEDEHNYIINETAAREFNMHAPVIGQRFTWGGDTGQVIGIVKDFHYKSMHEAIGPMVLMNGDSYSSYIFAKTVPANISKAIGAAESVWAKYVPNQPLITIFSTTALTRFIKPI